MKLEDLKIIISGGAQGMGRHFAQRLAEAGAQVAIGDVNEVGLAETVENTKGLKGKVHALKLETGTKLWELDLNTHPDVKSPGMFYGAPVVHDGKIYLATCNLHGEAAWRPTTVVCLGES